MKVLSLVLMFCFGLFFSTREFPCFNNMAVVG